MVNYKTIQIREKQVFFVGEECIYGVPIAAWCILGVYIRFCSLFWRGLILL